MSPADEAPDADPQPVQVAIDGVLDLHSFRPQEIGRLVTDYLDACAARDIREVKLIHGKGIGALKRTVHAVLARHPDVVEFHLDNPMFSGDGATLVRLRPRGDASKSGAVPG